MRLIILNCCRFTKILAILNAQAVMISVNDCGCIGNIRQIDSAQPFGDYFLNMSLPNSRSTLLHLMKTVYSGAGTFDSMAILAEFDSESKQIVQSEYEIKIHSDVSLWRLPSYGFLKVSLRKSSRDVKCSKELPEDFKLLEGSISSTDSPASRIQMIEEYFHMDRSKEIYCEAHALLRAVGRLSGKDPSRNVSLSQERLAIVIGAFNSIVLSPTQKFQLLDFLNREERLIAEDKLGIMPFIFTPNNLTGCYRLNLSKVGSRDRDIAIQLLEKRKRARSYLDRISKRSNSGLRAEVELMWRNARTLILKPMETIAQDVRLGDVDNFRIPNEGILIIDFVDLHDRDEQRLSNFQHFCIEPARFAEILANLRSRCSSQDILLEIRQLANKNLFTCLQVVALIELFPIDTINRYARVEVAVCLFSRITDWRGFRHVVRHVGARLVSDVEHRLGKVNLYGDMVVNPVGWWELDLEKCDERWLMQELVHLANKEPGNNLIEFTLDCCSFNVPREWLLEVPAEHTVTFFYCRSEKVIQKCMHYGSWTDSLSQPSPTSFPPRFYIPSLPDSDASSSSAPDELPQSNQQWTWVEMEKIRVVADSLRRHSRSAEAMFAEMDADGGGEISRAEFSLGLMAVGAWLGPEQLQALFAVIDHDRSGDISAAELLLFWVHAPPLRAHDGEQQAYWQARGVSAGAYARLLGFYDVRSWYPSDEVRLYGMDRERYTLIDEPTLVVRTVYDSSATRLVSLIGRAGGRHAKGSRSCAAGGGSGPSEAP